MKTDNYGQVHNSASNWKDIAYALQDHEIIGDPQIFKWADDRMSSFTVLLYLSDVPGSHINKLLYVGVEGYGFHGFATKHWIDPGYVNQKIKVGMGSAEPLADLINGVLDNIYPNRGTPKRGEALTCICKTDSSMDWAAGDSKCPVHSVWQGK